jgi:hypothetical protein
MEKEKDNNEDDEDKDEIIEQEEEESIETEKEDINEWSERVSSGGVPANKIPDDFKTDSKGKKEFYWVLSVMGIMIGILIVSSLIFQSFNNFEYENLAFSKERFGEIPVYRHSYFISSPITGEVTTKYNLFLRKDPRKVEVPITGDIEYPSSGFVYLSVNATGLLDCKDSSIAVAGLTAFMSNNQLLVRGASPDKEQAEKAGAWYVSCDERPVETDNLAIIIQKGEETKIEKVSDDCFIIDISQCEILDALEKFEVQSILDALKRAES